MAKYARDWKPRNLGGTIYDDPRQELAWWANRAGDDPMVAVPVATLRAAAEAKECGDRYILTNDEDGPCEPTTIQCRKLQGHSHLHYNGYASWGER